jgi:mono/diheme cytochrome c family protein
VTVGRHLFAAKGCFTCHVELHAGPDLFSKRYTKEYVTQGLANPERAFAGRQGTLRMPNLNLKPREIAALAAYVSANKGVAVR